MTQKRGGSQRRRLSPHFYLLPSRLDANPLGESIRGRLGRVYDAAISASTWTSTTTGLAAILKKWALKYQ